MQGRNVGDVLHWYVADLNVNDLLSASSRIEEWLPNDGTDSGQAFIGACGGDAGGNVLRALDPTDAKPALGIVYETTVGSLPEIDTLADPLQAVLLSTGGGPTALYMEYGTQIENDPDVTPNCDTVTPDGSGEYPGCKISTSGLRLNLAERWLASPLRRSIFIELAPSTTLAVLMEQSDHSLRLLPRESPRSFQSTLVMRVFSWSLVQWRRTPDL